MGARPSSFKRGGGYLNEVDATLVGYTFEVGETSKIKKGDRKGEDFTPLSFVPQFEVDGDDDSKDDPKTQRLLIGDAEQFGEVSDDGLTLSTPDGQSIGARSEAGIFIASLCAGGFPEERFSDSDDEINYEPAIGTRLRLVQQVNEEKTKRQGKQKNEKTGKQYDRKDLLVQTVHEVPGGKATGKAAKPSASSKPAAKGKKVADADEVDIPTLASATLQAILADAKDNTILKSKLSMAVLKKLTRDDNRETVREWLMEDENLEGLDGITYNKKKQIIVAE